MKGEPQEGGNIGSSITVSFNNVQAAVSEAMGDPHSAEGANYRELHCVMGSCLRAKGHEWGTAISTLGKYFVTCCERPET